jgi:molybdate transport system ATP-binding protein
MESTAIEIDVEKRLISHEGEMVLRARIVLENGKLFVLFGDSGAGKSTLLRILAGLTTPDRGYIRFGNRVLLDTAKHINLPPQERNVGLMFQDYALFPNMTVFENIMYAQKTRDKKYTETLLDKFGLSEFANRKPEKLSGGQKQRVALARALARKPCLLLLDEPLSALDHKTRLVLQDEIMKAHKLNDTTTLLVSHDLAEVFRLAHEVIHIRNGTILGKGRPDELFMDHMMSSKVQITGTVVSIEQPGIFYLVTIVTGMNQIIKVTAFRDDLKDIRQGDAIMVFTKAFNPVILKLK